MKEIYEQAKLLSYTVSEEEFYEYADNTAFTDIYIDRNGRLKLHADGISVDVGDIRKDFPCSDTARLYAIAKAELKDGTLLLTDSLGTSGEIGAIADYLPAAYNPIVGVTVNLQNELLLLFKDQTVMKAGTMRSNPFDASPELLLFQRNGLEYNVIGAYDRNIECAAVSATHLGKAVTAIADRAFEYCAALESVIIPDAVTAIGSFAFKDCTSLKSVVIPKDARILSYAFSGCSALETVYFGGTAADWENLSAITSGNDMLFAARKYYYSETEPTENKQLYWHYENGTPRSWA
ncbi:MAG: hypothetical protein DBX59_05340 [Bacillota bacterium]|nr:MAG: hypothetical protein DBX59_05340 [Bacillota bacterium]